MTHKKRVVMINDCAFDGRNIVRELRKEQFPIYHFMRTRGFWDKTIGITLKILRAKGSLYHVNYALQDAFLTLLTKKFLGKKPVIVHCHGSDLRTAYKKRQYRSIVKFNVRNANYVFVADLDTLDTAQGLNATATWIPIPIDLDIFFPKDSPISNDGILKFIYANAISEKIRGSLTFLKAFNNFAKDYKNVLLNVVQFGDELRFAEQLCKNAGTLNKYVKFIPLIPHENIVDAYQNHDITIGVFKSGIVSSVGLESWAVKRPILNYIDPKLYPDFKYISAQTEEQIVEGLHKLTDAKTRERLANAGFRYVSEYHDLKKVAQKVKKVYVELM